MDEILLKEIYSGVKKGYKVAFATITKVIGSTPGKMGSTPRKHIDNFVNVFFIHLNAAN